MTTNKQRFVTKEVVVDDVKLKKLKRLLGTKNDSETIQRAIDDILDAEQMLNEIRKLRKRGTWVDTYGRTVKQKKTPASGS